MANELREKSKERFNNQSNDQESIQTGCLQRMADSLERIEKPYLDMLNRNKYLSDRVRDQESKIQSLERSISTYKGHITRLKTKNGNHE